MRLNKYLSGLVKSELNFIVENANFTDEEMVVFTCIAKNQSIVAISEKCNISTSSVSNRIKSIKDKLNRLGGDFNARQ